MNKKKKRDRRANFEKEELLNPERLEEKRKKAARRRIAAVLGILILLFGIGFGSLSVVRAMGKANLKAKAATSSPELEISVKTEPIPEEQKEKWKEGWIRYQGKVYAYNEDVMTFLIMGIDKNSEAVEVEEGTNGGQADALFLAVMNPHKKSIEVVGVNRNTMADVEIYNEMGAYVTTTKAQIAVQHGFGNGVQESCEYQKKAVANLFYNLPIHGYAAINMSAIPTINDAVGGVDVTVLEDLSRVDKSLVKDEKVHLLGQSAFWYVKYRDTNEFGSADRRLERQKQYLTAFIGAAKAAAKKDISVALDLYRAVMPMMTSDVTIDEVAYLAPILVEYQFGQENFHMMKGETVMGEQYEEFYPDEDALYELILDVFYEEVDLES